MRNTEYWKPSKFVRINKKLKASRNPKMVAISSRMGADLVAAQFDAHLKNHVKGNLADLGCGKVPLYEAYKDYATDCTCIDWNSHDEHNHLDIKCDLNEILPIASANFDTVILSDVLEHIAKPEQLWSEIARILRPSGKVIISVPFFYKLHEVPYDYYRYTEFALKRFADINGFDVLILSRYGGVPEILADVVGKNVLRVPLFGKLLCRFVQGSCALFLKTGLGKKLSEKTARTFPFGYFMVAQKK